MPNSPDDIGGADTIDGVCKYCLLDRINAGLPPARNDPELAQRGIALCENLCLLEPPAATARIPGRETPRDSFLQREARIALERRLSNKPWWCRHCHGPIKLVDRLIVCVNACQSKEKP